MSNQKVGDLRDAGRRWPAGALMLLILAGIVVLIARPVDAVFEPPFLLQVLNTLFLGIVPVLASLVAMRAYLKLGFVGFLFMGTGLLVFGVTSTIAGWLISTPDGPNDTVTMHNLGVLAASLFHLFSALLFATGAAPDRPGRRVLAVAVLCSTMGLCITALGAALALRLFPPFFVPASGPTDLRQGVLACAVIFYEVAALLLLLRSPRGRSLVLDRFMISLALVGLGLAGIFFQKEVGSPIGWLGRGAQYAAGVYMLLAVTRAIGIGRARHLGVEQALSAFFMDAEGSYHTLADALRDAVITVDADGRILLWNAAAQAMFGWSAGEALGAPAEELLLAPGQTGPSAHPFTDPSPGTDGPALLEMVCRRRGGAEFPAEASFSLRRLETGPVWTWLVRDITRHRESERRLRDSELRFRTIAETIPSLVLINRRADGTILYANPAFKEALGYAGVEVAGRPARDFYWDPAEQEYLLAEFERRGFIADWELKTRRRDGSPLWVLLSLLPVFYDGTPALLFAAMDLTERLRAEEELRRARDQLEERVHERTAELEQTADQLRRLSVELTAVEERERKRLALVLHDGLQQLLSAALMGLGSLARAADPGTREAAGHVESVLAEAIRASRTLTGELSPAVHFDAGLVSALRWLARWIEEKHHLPVDVAAQGEEAPLEETLAIILFRAVRELLVNAAKHARARAAVVEVTLSPTAVQLVVRDDGRGFDMRAALATGGLGLFSIREQLAIHGGQLAIESAPGRGSRFVISLSLGAASAAPGAAAGPRDDPGGHGGAVDPGGAAPPVNVLLVDDHAVVRQGLASLLALYPDIAVIGEAVDGVRAVQEARRLRPDVIVMDVSMPHMDGVEATARIHGELPGIRIIGHTMFEADDLTGPMAEAGACCFVSKSGPTDALVSAIRSAAPRSAGGAAGSP
jgi:PAS domain S-box-containing protein